MRLIPMSYSLDYFTDDLIYTDSLLNANPITASLSESAKNFIGKCEDTSVKIRQISHERMSASALLSYADFSADHAIKSFSLELLNVVEGNRKSEKFQKYFKISPSMTTKLPLNEEINEIDRIISEIKRETDERLKSHQTVLENSKENLKKCIDDLNKVEVLYQNAMQDVIALKSNINRLRLGLYAELLSIATENNLPRAWAETFFHSTKAASEKQEEPQTSEQP